MTTPRGQKRQLEMARLERAARKRARRQARSSGESVEALDSADEVGHPPLSETELIEALAAVHQRFADDEITLEELEAERESLSQRLHIT